MNPSFLTIIRVALRTGKQNQPLTHYLCALALALAGALPSFAARQSRKPTGEPSAGKRPRRTSFLVLLTFAMFVGQPTPGLAQAGPNWMAQNQLFIQTVPLKGIAMPGSHDTFSYIENGTQDGTYASFFETQDLDITRQLNAGVRHFDMRTYLLDSNGVIAGGSSCPNAPNALPLSGAGYYMHIHGYCSGVRLDDVLDRISSFLDANPQEIVLLHFSGTILAGSPTYETSAAFESVLDQHLRRGSDGASYIYSRETACNLSGLPWTSNIPYPYFETAPYSGFCAAGAVIPQEVTPQQLYSTSARVIAIAEFGQNLTGTGSNNPPDYAKLTWPDSVYQTPPPPYPPGNVETLGGDNGAGAADPALMDQYLEYASPQPFLGLYGTRPVGDGYESDPKFLTLQANLTPGGPGFLIANPPMDDARVYNPHLASLIQTTWTPYSLNVVQVDNVEYAWCSVVSNSQVCNTVADKIVGFNTDTFGRVPFGSTGASQISVSQYNTVYKLGFTDGSGSGPLGQNHRLSKRTGNSGYFSDWTDLPVAGSRIAADPSGNVWILDDTGFLFRLNADGSVSNNLPMSLLELQDIAIDNKGTLYAILRGFDLPMYYSNDQWQVLSGLNNAVRIAAKNGVVAVLDTNGNVQQYQGNGTWAPLNQPFKATSVAVDDNGFVWATQAEQAVGAYTGYTPVPTSGLWARFGNVWQQFRTDGVQVAIGASIGGNKPFDVVFVMDKNGNMHNLEHQLFPSVNQGQAPPPQRYAPQVTVSGLTFSHATQLFTGTLTVTNNTGTAITDQLAVLFEALPSGVTIANNPLTYQGEPFILMPPGTLEPGASVSTQVQFKDPNQTRITYSNIVYAYVSGS